MSNCAPLGQPVDVTGGLTTELEISLVREPMELEPVVVLKTRPWRLEIKGFYALTARDLRPRDLSR